MKQKARYIFRQRGAGSAEAKSAEQAVMIVDELVAGFIRSAYSRSAKSVHGEPDRRQAERVRDYTRIALLELLNIR